MEVEMIKIAPSCKKRNLFERLFNIDALHNWQTRATNRYGLSTYEVCLKCGGARKRLDDNIFVTCDRIDEFDNQFDSKGNYIFSY